VLSIRARVSRFDLHSAVESGDIESVKRLLEKGANVNLSDKNGQTPLLITARGGCAREELIDQRIFTKTASSTWIHLDPNICAEIAQLLINYGANLQARDLRGQTPLHLSVHNSGTQTAKVLILNGADINAKDKYGRTPLSTLFTIGSIQNEVVMDFLKLLVENGGDINEPNGKLETPLLQAVKLYRLHRDLNMINYLLEQGADVNLKDCFGNTPLSIGLKYEDEELVQLLRKYGAKEWE